MKITFAALAAAGALFLSAAPAFAEDAPSAPAAPADSAAYPAAPSPAPATAVVAGGCGCEPTCCDRGWTVWLEPMLIKFQPCVPDWAVDGDATASLPTGNVHEVEYDYELGFRAGVAYMKPGGVAGFGVQVTWANPDSDESATAPAGGSIALTHNSANGNDFVLGGSATHHSEIDYLVLDVAALFQAPLGEEGSATVWGGLRFARIDMDTSESISSAAGVVLETLDASTELLGYGLAVGGELRWKFCGGWSFRGKAAAGVLMSNIDGSALDQIIGGPTIVNVSNEVDRITPFFEMGIGIGWGCDRFLGSCIGLNVDLGFELVNWFNVVDPLSFVDDVKDSTLDQENDDLGYSALTLKVTLDF